MKSVYEKLFKSRILIYKSKNKGFIDFQAITSINKRKIYIIIDKSTCSSAELFAGLAQSYEGAILIGNKMYGKNMVCKRKKINDMVIHIPENYFFINRKNPTEIKPDYEVDNICEYNEEQILTLCQNVEQRRLTEGERV